MCLLGTFSPYVTVHQSSVVKIEKDIPLDKAALLGCGVATGWGSATEIGRAREGDVVVVVGVGGIGINSVQGAASAGARAIVAVDPVEFKREKALEFGATHTCSSMDEAMALVGEISWGRMADLVILTMGVVEGKDLLPGLLLTGKGRRCVVVGLGDMTAVDAQVSILDLAMQQKTLQGAIFGGVGPRKQIPHLLHQYRAGNRPTSWPPDLPTRGNQPGLPGHARRQEHLRRHLRRTGLVRGGDDGTEQRPQAGPQPHHAGATARARSFSSPLRLGGDHRGRWWPPPASRGSRPAPPDPRQPPCRAGP